MNLENISYNIPFTKIKNKKFQLCISTLDISVEQHPLIF